MVLTHLKAFFAFFFSTIFFVFFWN